MSGEITNQVIDLAHPEQNMFYYVETDTHYKLTLYPTIVAGPITRGGDQFASGIGVTNLNGVGDHRNTLITRILEEGAELRVQTWDGVVDHRCGRITLMIKGNCR